MLKSLQYFLFWYWCIVLHIDESISDEDLIDYLSSKADTIGLGTDIKILSEYKKVVNKMQKNKTCTGKDLSPLNFGMIQVSPELRVKQLDANIDALSAFAKCASSLN